MPLPPVRYLSAGPAPRQASVSAATAQGEAMARMGATIAAVGEKGFQIAQQVREREEAGKISAYFSALDEQAGEFSNSLLRRTDPDQWPADWRDMVSGFKDQASQLSLSPVARAALDREIQQWSTRRTIQFEGLSAQRAVDESRALINIGFDQALSRGDREAAERQIALMPGAGLMPSQVEEARTTMERGLARQSLDEELRMDPEGTIARLEADDFLHQPGNEHLTLEDRDRALYAARGARREQILSSSDEFQDLAAQGTIRTAEDLDRHFQGRNIPPRILENWKGQLAARTDAETKALRSTPGYQASTVAKVQDFLDTYTVEDDDFDQAFVEADGLVRSLPAGATRDELARQLRQSREGQVRIIEDWKDYHRAQLEDFRKAGLFGDSTAVARRPVTDAVRAGILKDVDKLEKTGIPPETARKIAKEKDPREQISMLKAARAKAAKEGGFLDTNEPYDRQVFDTLLKGDGFLERPDLAARETARRKFGSAKIDFENWLRAYPKATEEQGRAKIAALAGTTASAPPSPYEADGSLLPPPPQD